MNVGELRRLISDFDDHDHVHVSTGAKWGMPFFRVPLRTVRGRKGGQRAVDLIGYSSSIEVVTLK